MTQHISIDPFCDIAATSANCVDGGNRAVVFWGASRFVIIPSLYWLGYIRLRKKIHKDKEPCNG
jgi:hypothetical protein